MTGSVPAFLHDLIGRLRRRGLPLGVDDCAALRAALAAGHGLGSDAELRRLCVLLWAKSSRDAELITSAFHLVATPSWALTAAVPASTPADLPAAVTPSAPAPIARSGPWSTPPARRSIPGAARERLRPAPPLAGTPEVPPTGRSAPSLVLTPRYPITEREVAQTWRRLRRPVRHGPPVELDADTTIARYARTGVVDAPVLRPARGNAARLLLLIDRHGSMTPYHGLVDHVVDAITGSARLDTIAVAYFRNVPGRSPDRTPLAELPDAGGTDLDAILGRVGPLPAGRAYHDPALTQPVPLTTLLDGTEPGSAVAVVSDGGALRGSFSLARLYDTVAFLRAVAGRRVRLAWLNPAPPARWPGTTAGQVARHVPMSPLTRAGMHEAVGVLHGRPRAVERPL